MKIYTRDLFDRLFSRKHSYRDQLLIEQGFEDPKKLEKTKKIAEDRWNELNKTTLSEPVDLKNIYYKLYYQIGQGKRFSRMVRFKQVFSKVAAVLFIPLLITVAWYYWSTSLTGKQHPIEISFAAPEGTRSRFVLPDGTAGWLNGGSQLVYSAGKTKNREVELAGEAFFEVAEDSRHPFVVNAQLFDVTVTGTRFNVYAHPDEDWADLVLESGNVTINNRLKEEEFKIVPGQRFAMSKKTGNHHLADVDVAEYLDWIDGKLYFRNDPMDLVVRKLERYYNVDIEIADNSILQYKFRAILQNETLEEVIRFMAISLPISATFNPRNKQQDGTFNKQKIILKTR